MTHNFENIRTTGYTKQPGNRVANVANNKFYGKVVLAGQVYVSSKP
jgi:hypothetical protein